MEKGIQLDIVTPDNAVCSKRVDYVSAPGIEGEFGVLPGHVPMLAALKIGCLSYKEDGKMLCAFVSGGFCEVSDDKVTVLAESSELEENIDLARAAESKKRAEQRLQNLTENLSADRAEAALQRALVRLQIGNRPRGL